MPRPTPRFRVYFAILLLYWVPGRYFRRHATNASNPTHYALSAASVASIITVILCGIGEALLMSGRFATVYSFTMVLMYALVLQQAAHSR